MGNPVPSHNYNLFTSGAFSVGILASYFACGWPSSPLAVGPFRDEGQAAHWPGVDGWQGADILIIIVIIIIIVTFFVRVKITASTRGWNLRVRSYDQAASVKDTTTVLQSIEGVREELGYCDQPHPIIFRQPFFLFCRHSNYLGRYFFLSELPSIWRGQIVNTL